MLDLNWEPLGTMWIPNKCTLNLQNRFLQKVKNLILLLALAKELLVIGLIQCAHVSHCAGTRMHSNPTSLSRPS